MQPWRETAKAPQALAYFSATGQLWGNPLYDWAQVQRDGFAFWLQRLRWQAGRYDLVILDIREKDAFDAGHVPGALNVCEKVLPVAS